MIANNQQGFLDDVRRVLGSQNVIDSAEELELLFRDTIPGAILPIGVIRPGSTQEVAAAIRLANQYKVTVWPHSTGRNWGYSNAPLQGGSVVMTLERMTGIIRVDEKMAYAVIEPGVSYEQLNAYLKERGIKLWIDCTGGPPKASVLGNALDRGVGVTPHGDHFASMCGCEVVLPDGTIIQTGGYPNGQEGTRYTYKWGVGPYADGLFSQSNFGIVTRAGIWLMPEPEAFLTLGLVIQDERNFAFILDEVRKLALQGIVPDKVRFSNDVALLTILTQWIHEKIEGKSCLTEDDLKRLTEKYQTGRWTFCTGLYGPAEQVAAMKRRVIRALSPYGKVVLVNDRRIRFVERIAPPLLALYKHNNPILNFFLNHVLKLSMPLIESLPAVSGLYKGIPTERIVQRAYFKYEKPRPAHDVHVARDQVGLIWFAPLVPLDGQVVLDFINDCREKFRKHEMDCYITIMMLTARTVVPFMAIMYRAQVPDECQKALALYDELYADTLARGYQQFRAGRLGWPSIFKESPELLSFYQSLKKAIDPHNIIAPGRYGI